MAYHLEGISKSNVSVMSTATQPIPDNSTLAYVDLFCGAGGVSSGIISAGHKVLAAVNHDPLAIASHEANHPGILHYAEDMRTLELSGIVAAVAAARAQGMRIVLWASLECTNFSNAKGGAPRDADSRTLAEHLFRYIEAIKPDYVQIENVAEFMSWGPLNDKGRPVSRTQGRDYLRWVNNVCSYGYHYDYKVLDCANYGDATHRRRLFGIFARHGLRIGFPAPTHGESAGGMMGGRLAPLRPVRECLDLHDHGLSIFGRKKPLVDKTLTRILAGLEKFVAKGNKQWMEGSFSCLCCGNTYVVPQSGEFEQYFVPRGRVGHIRSLNRPCSTLLTKSQEAVVSPQNFLMQYYSGNDAAKCRSIDRPCSTLTTSPHEFVCRVEFTQDYLHAYACQPGRSINRPFATITTTPHHYAVAVERIPAFMTSYYGNSDVADVKRPCPTLTTKDRHCPIWIDKQYGSGKHNYQSADAPAGAITTTPKLSLCTAYLFNPGWSGNASSIDRPCPVIVARQDKAPLYYISTDEGQAIPAIRIEPTDSPVMVRIKMFMAAYGLSDIRMRMLTIKEMLRITSLPEDYTLMGTQADQKKFIGNAVPVRTVAALVSNLAIINKQ
jgi:DNA (cytosine-5)-methyltransferase 1